MAFYTVVPIFILFFHCQANQNAEPIARPATLSCAKLDFT